VLNVLFLCTGNSARSILAEAVLNGLPAARGRFRAFSAGSHPRGEVHPLALEVLRAHDVPVTGLRSKSWDEFGGAEGPEIDLVITVCDQAAAEQCPFWPGHPTTAHWGLPDPALAEGSHDQRRAAFERTLLVLTQRLERLAALPIERLGREALADEVVRIASVAIVRTGRDGLAPVLELLAANHLPLDGLADHDHVMLTAREDGRLVGCVALELYSDGALLRSLAVDVTTRGSGVGTLLVRAAIDEAGQLGAPGVYLLTTTAERFFPRFGFVEIDRVTVPPGVRGSVEFQTACPATAVAMKLVPSSHHPSR